MSLSDAENNNFKPIDIGSLDNFEDEVSNKNDETAPNYDRFKLLFEPEALSQDGSAVFETLHLSGEEKKLDPFQPLIEEPKPAEPVPEPAGAGASPVPEPGADTPSPAGEEGPDPLIALREQAYEQGFSKGFKQGEQAGEAKGYEEGFTRGETEGFTKGEADGFAKGEANGFAKGEAEGRETGEAAAREEAVPTLDTLSQSLISVESVLEELVAAHEKELLELTFTIVRKVITASLDTDDDVVRHTILDALKGLAIPREIELNVSPEDYDYIEMMKDSFFEAMESLEHVAIKSDPMVNRGGCRIDTATAAVATDPEAKLEAVYRAVVQGSR